ncbi:MAG: bacteriophage holin [Phycisphaerae bacterium]|nr:bacteriophage holin [Phycisphaerae bacterium]
MKLNVKAFALACGLLWGLGVFFLTWWLILLEGNNPAGCFLNRMYPSYTMTPIGSIIGAVWGFFDAGIGGLIFAWLYNLLVDKCSKEKTAQ